MGKRDDPLAPRAGLAGDQAARPARPSRQPAARPLPAVLVPSRSPTAATRSLPRPPAARSATTSATTRPAAAGTSTPRGRPPRPPCRPWANCGPARWWRLTSTTVTWPPPSSRRTATCWASRPPLPSVLAGLPSATRDGHLRAAISALIAAAKARGARAIVIEDLNFDQARDEGRERADQPALPRPARPGLPARRGRHPYREVPGPVDPDGRQRRTVGDRRRFCVHLPLGSRALAAALAGAPPRSDRSPRGSAGDRATRARAPGQAPRDRDPYRPGGRGAASPGAAPDHPEARGRTQETRRPTRPPAATRHQDRTASPDHGRQPGSPRPSGAAA